MRALVLILLSACLAAEDLDALFARAARDPAALAPLIAAGSRAVIELPSERAVPLAERLAPFCLRAFFSPEAVAGGEALGLDRHVVEAKETWTGIARRQRVGAELLQRLNASPTLRVGRAIKVLDAASAPLALVVSRSRFRLLAWRGQTLVGCFPVSIGKPGHETPLGETRVIERVRDPEWRDPDTGRIYAGRDPGNVLGGFWLGFDPLPRKQFRGIGIHGFTAADPASWLGTASSHGCVRLDQDGVRAIFDLALPGTKIVIRD